MIKKADIFVLLIFFAIILSVFTVSFFGNVSGYNKALNIYSDGKLKYSFSLPIYQEKEIEIYDNGYNKIYINGDTACVKEADCKGKDCMNFGQISEVGEFIICSPNKLLICIEGEVQNESTY